MNCPTCDAVIYSRRSGLCGVCGAQLPETMLFDSEQREKLDVQMARMKAEKLNGGLNVYRPAACMFDRAAGDCIVESSDQGILFRFQGGQPGWQQLNLPATVETEIRVSQDGRSILAVVYNGPVRLSSP